eukprot:3325011-Alexandrium_andersonii.AAC.1
MPALYALGQHAALAEADRQLHEDELLFAFLDDVYVCVLTGAGRCSLRRAHEHIGASCRSPREPGEDARVERW